LTALEASAKTVSWRLVIAKCCRYAQDVAVKTPRPAIAGMALGALWFAAAAQSLCADETARALVRKLDAVRLPGTSFAAEVRTAESGGKKGEEQMRFRLYAKEMAGAFSSLAVLLEPEKDRNKVVLSTREGTWFCDPRANHATRISDRQMWKQSFAVDSLTVRLATDYEASLAGEETIGTLDSGKRKCRVVDLVPKKRGTNPVRLIRYWVDANGRPWQAHFFGGMGNKLLRQARFGSYRTVLGASRPMRMVVTQGGESATLKYSGHQATSLPDSLFEVKNLPRLQLNEPAD
jgi:outer membrane lipoprotein-sorting protein